MYQILNDTEDLDNLRCHPLAFTQRHRLNGGCKVTGHAGKNTDLMSADTGIGHPQTLDSRELRRRVKHDVVDPGDRRNAYGVEFRLEASWARPLFSGTARLVVDLGTEHRSITEAFPPSCWVQG